MNNIFKDRDELIRLINIRIGTNIVKRRELLKLTRLSLANEIGISPESIRQYEAGNNNISAARLFLFSLELGIPVEQFFVYEEDNAPVVVSEHDKIFRITREFFKLSSPRLAASVTALIEIAVEEARSEKKRG